MNQLTRPADTKSRATAFEIDASLISLASLPSRQTDDAERDNATYHVALEGVTRYALAEAVKAILRGALRHPFFPNPVELRQQCDEAHGWVLRQASRQRMMEEQQRERRQYDASLASRTPEAMAHQQRSYQQYLRGMGHEADDPNAFKAAMEAKYGKHMLDSVPDRSVSERG